jgi:hypothetical protein
MNSIFAAILIGVINGGPFEVVVTYRNGDGKDPLSAGSIVFDQVGDDFRETKTVPISKGKGEIVLREGTKSIENVTVLPKDPNVQVEKFVAFQPLSDTELPNPLNVEVPSVAERRVEREGQAYNPRTRLMETTTSTEVVPLVGVIYSGTKENPKIHAFLYPNGLRPGIVQTNAFHARAAQHEQCACELPVVAPNVACGLPPMRLGPQRCDGSPMMGKIAR